MIDNYKYFIGKVCTILTHHTDLMLRDAMQHAQYFSGVVIEVNSHGIRIKHLNANTIGFYTFPIIGIVEEQSIAESDPHYNQIKEEIEKKKSGAIKPPIKAIPSNITSVEDMTRRAKQIKAQL